MKHNKIGETLTFYLSLACLIQAAWSVNHSRSWFWTGIVMVLANLNYSIGIENAKKGKK